MKKKAIVYTRVSTDEQNNGYSPADQREKLLSFCERQEIEVVGFYHDDESGKSFKRPEWIKIMAYLRKHKNVVDYVYFLKWDRFSRNATEAYAELAKLKKLGVEARAMEQPLDLEIPEQKVLLAIYLTAPEVDNDRRALNVFHGMRRARKEGRWMGGKPLGYRNTRDQNNRPIIAPEGGLIESLVVRAFHDFATGLYSTEELRAKYVKLGLKCCKNSFANMLQSQAYIGKVLVPKYKNEREQWIQGQHQPLIDELTFLKCQEVINGRKRKVPQTFNTLRDEFPLRGFLICPQCGKSLTASTSKGKYNYFSYYHCFKGCKERQKVEVVHQSLEELLHVLSPKEEPMNLLVALIKAKYKEQNQNSRAEAAAILREIGRQEQRLSNARDLMLDGDISSDDFKSMKAEIDQTLSRLRFEHIQASTEVAGIDKKLDQLGRTMSNILSLYKSADLAIKRKLIGSMFPKKLTFEKNAVRTLELNPAVLLISSKINASRRGKKDKHTNFGVLTCQVESEGFEPSSKQWELKLSTCLFRD